MDKKELKKIKKLLLERKMEILDAFLEEHNTYIEHLNPETGDLADEAYDVIERDLAYDLSVAEKKELDEINHALEKIEKGRYGICELCGAPIPAERLKIMPYAQLCVNCKEKQERKKRTSPEEQNIITSQTEDMEEE